MLLVERIEEHHKSMGTVPTGDWKSRGVPNFNDKRLIPLSQVALDVVCGRS